MNTAWLTRKAITVVATPTGEACRSWVIAGRATLTMVVSMMAMNMAST